MRAFPWQLPEMLRTHDHRPRFFVWTAACAVILSLTLVAAGHTLAGANEASELRGDLPTGESIRDELATGAERRTELVGQLAAAERDLDAAVDARADLDESRRGLVVEIEAATEMVRRTAVEAFVTGGSAGDLRYLLEVTEVSELSWRQYLVRNHAGSTEQAAGRLEALLAEADDDVLASVALADELRQEQEELSAELASIDQRAIELDDLRPIAEAWDRAEAAIAEGRYGFVSDAKWERLRFCESRHDYGAISPSGTYRGAYQFDHTTWRSVGGTGDPAAAPPAEQDARAHELYARRGAAPWPICGKHLR